MGHMQAQSYADLAHEGYDLDVVLMAHLQSNHYPPIHPVFVPVAKEAIERANADDWDHVIEMPNEIAKPVSEIVEELHLGAFLDQEDED